MKLMFTIYVPRTLKILNVTNLNSLFLSQIYVNKEISASDCENQFNDYYTTFRSVYNSNFIESVDLNKRRNFVNLNLGFQLELQNRVRSKMLYTVMCNNVSTYY